MRQVQESLLEPAQEEQERVRGQRGRSGGSRVESRPGGQVEPDKQRPRSSSRGLCILADSVEKTTRSPGIGHHLGTASRPCHAGPTPAIRRGRRFCPARYRSSYNPSRGSVHNGETINRGVDTQATPHLRSVMPKRTAQHTESWANLSATVGAFMPPLSGSPGAADALAGFPNPRRSRGPYDGYALIHPRRHTAREHTQIEMRPPLLYKSRGGCV